MTIMPISIFDGETFFNTLICIHNKNKTIFYNQKIYVHDKNLLHSLCLTVLSLKSNE